jgi:NADH-quinone oxidoreductase subunit C
VTDDQQPDENDSDGAGSGNNTSENDTSEEGQHRKESPVPPIAATGDRLDTASPDERADLAPTPTGPGAAETPDVMAVREGMFGAKGSPDTSGYGRLKQVVEFPGPSPRPYGGWFDAVVDRIIELLDDPGDVLKKVVVDRGELTLHIAREHIKTIAQVLRDDAQLRFEFFSGVSGVHYPTDEGKELHAVYHVASFTHNRRLRLETSAPESDPHIPSVTSVYPGADWHERETFDMFGLIFDGHPHLTRVLMPDDWPGHPQRKDYPLGGIPVEYKGTTVEPPEERRSYN